MLTRVLHIRYRDIPPILERRENVVHVGQQRLSRAVDQVDRSGVADPCDGPPGTNQAIRRQVLVLAESAQIGKGAPYLLEGFVIAQIGDSP
jgi:hypothetical protein